MPNFAYYLLWLAAGLVIIAIISAVMARHLRLRVLRRLKAVEVIKALSRYSEWVAAQRYCNFSRATPRRSARRCTWRRCTP